MWRKLTFLSYFSHESTVSHIWLQLFICRMKQTDSCCTCRTLFDLIWWDVSLLVMTASRCPSTKQTLLLKENQTDSFSFLHLLLLLLLAVFALITEQTCFPSATDENNSLTRTDGANSTSKSNKPSAHRRPFVSLPARRSRGRRREGQREKVSWRFLGCSRRFLRSDG